MIELRRRYSGGVQSPSHSRLPAGYQEVEYIESDSSGAFIKTDILYDSAKSYELHAKFMITQRTNYGGIINAGNAADKNCFKLLQRSISGDSGYYAIPNSLAKTANFSVNTTHGFGNIADVVLKENYFKINDETYTADTIIGAESKNEYYFELFRNIDNNQYFYLVGRIYVVELKEEGITLINLIPCYRISDRVAGMYDIVNDVFYTNAGTGTFIVGPDVIG